MLCIEEVYDITENSFKEAIAIYMDAIPAAERQTANTIKERITTKKEHLLVGRLNEKVVGMALIWPLQDSDFILLDYLAVKREYRKQGIGTGIIKHVKSICRAKGKQLILEAEDPKQGRDREVRECRIAVYRGNGAKELKQVPYQLPPLHGNYSTPMVLMVLAQGKEPEMDGNTVKKLIRQIYSELYGRGDNDSLLNTFIDLVPTTVKLE